MVLLRGCMFCKTCGYRLWNLPSRQCPECGMPFAPSEFEFSPYTVQFHCPQCNKAYYGSGPRGHLQPVSFNCVDCGRHVHMDEMTLSPTEGVREEQTVPERTPWLDRRKIGFFRAFFRTIGQAMTSPGKLMRGLPPDSPIGDAWLFLVLVSLLVPLGYVIYPGLLFIGVGMRVGGPSGIVFLGVLIAYSVGTVILIPVVVAIYGLFAHLLLRLWGKPRDTIGRTYEALCYGHGSIIMCAVPCLGLCFGWIWPVVSSVLTIKERQRVSGGRAAFAVVTPPVIGLMLFIGAYAGFMYYAITRAPGGAWGTANVYAASADPGTQIVLDGLLAYADANNNRLPAHVAELIPAHELGSWDLVLGGTASMVQTVPLGGATVDALDSASPARTTQIINAAVRALPANLAAYRLGDFVFPCVGPTLPTDGDLWLVIASPDPDMNTGLARGQQIVVVGLVNGEVVTISRSLFAARLAEQNAIRARAGLPPLPSPETVRHSAPATGTVAPQPSEAPEGPAEAE